MAGGAGLFAQYGQFPESLLRLRPVTPGYRKYKSRLQGQQYSCLLHFRIGLGLEYILFKLRHCGLERIAIPFKLRLTYD